MGLRVCFALKNILLYDLLTSVLEDKSSPVHYWDNTENFKLNIFKYPELLDQNGSYVFMDNFEKWQDSQKTQCLTLYLLTIKSPYF